jgi:hypothetical protein
MVMTLAEAIETMRIHRVAGLTSDRTAVVTTRPCRAPRHTISDAGLIGGGHVPTPGDVSLAHNGVLFLDEWPEFRRHVLEVWRQPLEESVICIQSPACPRSDSADSARRTALDPEGWARDSPTSLRSAEVCTVAYQPPRGAVQELTRVPARVLHQAFTLPHRIQVVPQMRSEEQRSRYPWRMSTLHGAEPSGRRPCTWGRQASAHHGPNRWP